LSGHKNKYLRQQNKYFGRRKRRKKRTKLFVALEHESRYYTSGKHSHNKLSHKTNTPVLMPRRWVEARGDGSDLVYEDHSVENSIEAEVEGGVWFRVSGCILQGRRRIPEHQRGFPMSSLRQRFPRVRHSKHGSCLVEVVIPFFAIVERECRTRGCRSKRTTRITASAMVKRMRISFYEEKM
jgi:hypothetical protein